LSKHDSKFFNTFSVVIGLLVALTLVLIGIARTIGDPFEAARAADDKGLHQLVADRTQPVGPVAVAGHDNSALAIVAASTGGEAPKAALPANGEETYKAVCTACHGGGIAGAPKFGDKAAWSARLAEGKPTLYEHAINGYKNKGVMPARGGNPALTDELVKEAVDYMAKAAQ
jgi:cytochrome c5